MVELVVQRWQGRPGAHRPQMHDLSRRYLSCGQVGEQRIIVGANAGTDRILATANSFVVVAGSYDDDLMCRAAQLETDLLAQSGRVLKNQPAGRRQVGKVRLLGAMP